MPNEELKAKARLALNKTREQNESAIVKSEVAKKEHPGSSLHGLLPSAIMGACKSEPPEDKDDKDNKFGLAAKSEQAGDAPSAMPAPMDIQEQLYQIAGKVCPSKTSKTGGEDGPPNVGGATDSLEDMESKLEFTYKATAADKTKSMKRRPAATI